MTQKRRDERRLRHRGEHPERWSAALRAITLAGSVALLVVSVLVPSEAAIPNGAAAPLAAGWCLLLVLWAASLFLDSEPVVHIGWTEVAGAAFVGWHSLAAVFSLGETNGRLALNAHWLVLSYGIAALLLRQFVRTLDQARNLVAAMLWLAAVLAALGLYQYFYSMPRQRLEYERNPTQALADAELPAASGSPLRELIENRVLSVEPIATFGLTNSLAGFLAPWLICALAIALANFDWTKHRRVLIGLSAVALLQAVCLVLTKSRSAYLAAAAGVTLIAIYGRGQANSKWRLDWRIPVTAAGIALLIGLAALLFGGLDVEVLSEAPKSVLYRIEYWQATARMILDHPLFGSGPGNFQESYATYKLPQASETVADPHNFLLEIWATAGTPALVLLLLLFLGFVRDVSKQGRQQQRHERDFVWPATRIIWGGAVAGLVIGPWVSAAMGLPLGVIHESFPLPVVWPLGALLLLGGWWLLRDWLFAGTLPLAAVIVPQIVLLINLLAAGAFGFPGVIMTILVLAPVALCVAEQSVVRSGHTYSGLRGDSASLPIQLRPSHAASGGIFLGAATIAAICLYTEYYPVLRGQSALAEALYTVEQRNFAQAEPKAAAAARTDSLSPEPWRLISDLRLARWQARERQTDWDDFVKAANVFQALNPRHHLAWFERGKWFLTAWKKSQDQAHLDEALSAFRQAVKHYPNKALYHAQLAWTLHLAGDEENARLAADTAWKLDQRMPHREQKLDRQHVLDPQAPSASGAIEREENAEQTVERLRTAPAEKKP
jgi:hypothetical protein